jgi:hypothetical protein
MERVCHIAIKASSWKLAPDIQILTNPLGLQAGPRMKFFEAIKKAVGKIDIVAEDLVRLPLYKLLQTLLCRHCRLLLYRLY